MYRAALIFKRKFGSFFRFTSYHFLSSFWRAKYLFLAIPQVRLLQDKKLKCHKNRNEPRTRCMLEVIRYIHFYLCWPSKSSNINVILPLYILLRVGSTWWMYGRRVEVGGGFELWLHQLGLVTYMLLKNPQGAERRRDRNWEQLPWTLFLRVGHFKHSKLTGRGGHC